MSFFRTLYNSLSTNSLCLSVRLVNTAGKIKATQYIQVDHKRTTWTEHHPTMLVSLATKTLKYELSLNGSLLSNILLYPLFHCHFILLVIYVCSTVCLMSQSFLYLQTHCIKILTWREHHHYCRTTLSIMPLGSMSTIQCSWLKWSKWDHTANLTSPFVCSAINMLNSKRPESNQLHFIIM